MEFDIAAIDLSSPMPAICIGNINKAGQIQSKVNMSIECGGMHRGAVHDIDAVSATLLQAVKAIKSQYGIGIKSAWVTVPCYMCKIDHGSVTENIPHKEIDEGTMQTIKEKLLSFRRHANHVVTDLALTKFVLDGNMEVRDPNGKWAGKLAAESNIIYLKNEYFTVLSGLFDRIGLQMDGLVMNTLGGLSMLPFSDSERSNIVMIHVSWEITDITVCRFGKIVYADTVFAGAKHIIKDVSIGLGIDEEDAARLLKNTAVADTQYIKQDGENTVKTKEGKTVVFTLSGMVAFVRDRILDIYDACKEKMEENGITSLEDYKVCIYGADIEKYLGYGDLGQRVFGVRIKKIPYALFEVEDISYGVGSGMIRYISHHPLLKKASRFTVKTDKKSRKKGAAFKKIIQFLKID